MALFLVYLGNIKCEMPLKVNSLYSEIITIFKEQKNLWGREVKVKDFHMQLCQ